MAFTWGFPDEDEIGEWLIIALWFSLPLFNLICILKKTAENNFISLYFKRKALEEKIKIEKLSEKK